MQQQDAEKRLTDLKQVFDLICLPYSFFLLVACFSYMRGLMLIQEMDLTAVAKVKAEQLSETLQTQLNEAQHTGEKLQEEIASVCARDSISSYSILHCDIMSFDFSKSGPTQAGRRAKRARRR